MSLLNINVKINKFWRLWHKWFKWEYVHVANKVLQCEFVRRVQYTDDSEPYVIWKEENFVYLCRAKQALPMSTHGNWFITPLTKGLEAKLLMFAEMGKFGEAKATLGDDGPQNGLMFQDSLAALADWKIWAQEQVDKEIDEDDPFMKPRSFVRHVDDDGRISIRGWIDE